MLLVNSLYSNNQQDILRSNWLILDSQLVLIKKLFDILILHTKALYTSIFAEESIPIIIEVYKIF